ncbi:response regulator [Corallococcus macrosporus]|uniref:FrzS n=1 Tax=Myxococcus fulvus (strain ATCC BAA-855 / HW-1) TaxID=483219 RepID=B8QZU7_MYXFH|nr:response regulator [Corallococcus macrosporus]ACJ60862.1 FrzS [Myxococcus fulvus HW-1]AEI67662.1 response regulator FrzS [Corallococcus macrosporus]
MSKKILIVESDTALSASLRSALEGRGFTVDETTDGKGSVEQIRRDRPDLVVLAVDLSAGQNGYLICGKLKKDDDLKNVPIVIIGNPDGFAQHRKLKAHADEYVAKPVDADLLVDRVGALIGFPELPAAALEDVVDESLTLDALGDEPMTADFGEEISVETAEEPPVTGEELDLDAAFGDLSAPEETPAFEEEVVVAPPEAVVEGVEEDFSTLDSLGTDAEDALDGLDDSEKTVVGFLAPAPTPAAPPPEPPRAVAPPPAPRAVAPPRPAPPPVSVAPAADAVELRGLRAKVAELQAELDDSRGTASHAEERVRDLEVQLEAQATELEAARASSGKNDKDTFALRDAANKKDKEILRLKTELNQKDQEIIELKDQNLELEQKASTAESELTQRDAQLKTLSARADSLAADRKRVDQQLSAAKDEARSASAQLTALQAELDQHQAQAHAYAAELEDLRARAGQLEADVQAARSEAEDLRVQLGQAQVELSEQSSRANAEAEELRGRIAELEAATARGEERVTRLYARIKSEEKLREKTKKALVIAQQLLEEPASAVADDASEAAA